MSIIIPMAQYKAWLPRWEVEVTLLITEKGPYNIIGEFCAILGIKRSQDQCDWLRERKATQGYVDQLQVRTRGGPQPTWCIHQRALGYWLGYIGEKKFALKCKITLLISKEKRLTHRMIGSSVLLRHLPNRRSSIFRIDWAIPQKSLQYQRVTRMKTKKVEENRWQHHKQLKFIYCVQLLQGSNQVAAKQKQKFL